MLFLQKKYFYFFINLFFIFSSFETLFAANFHSIIVADTEDESVGANVQTDLDLLRKETQRIALHTGLHLKETIFKVNKPEKLFATLKSLKIDKNDVIMFFYSGHGYNSDQIGKTPWPFLNFDDYKGVALKDIISILKGKHARLTLIFSNSCNKELPPYAIPPIYVKLAQKDKAQVKKNYNSLFLNSKGIVIGTSSKKGQYSWSHSNGSLFVKSFVNSFAQLQEYPQNVTWDEFIILLDDNLKNEASLFGVEQTPYFENKTSTHLKIQK